MLINTHPKYNGTLNKENHFIIIDLLKNQNICTNINNNMDSIALKY